jgi:molybdopterin-guanine dinucleotide biosynthesis protein A
MLSAAFVEFLFTQAEMGGHDVVMPVSPQRRDEPLCAVYAKSSAASIRREMDRGTRKITYALDALMVRRLLPDEYASLDPSGRTFTNINTIEELNTSRRERTAEGE